MSNRQVLKAAGSVAWSLLMCACAGKPVIDYEHSSGNAGATGGAGNSTSTDPNGTAATAGTAATGNGINTGNTNVCQTTCNPGECGPISDGCGKFIECGLCTLPETCGGSGIPSRCGAPGNPACTPKTCEQALATVAEGNCDAVMDGCGEIIPNCLKTVCADGATCGGGGIAGVCGVGVTCSPLTLASCGSICGKVGDGCGGVVDCPTTCAPGERCQGSPAYCTRTCTPLTCDQALATVPDGNCDAVLDGCGGIIPNCQKTVCTGAATCGGGGTPGVCGVGTPDCMPLAAASCGDICGKMADGCNGFVDCPTACATGEICQGSPGRCTKATVTCTATTCAALGATCGQVPDGCDGLLTCGTCGADQTCSSSNQCISTACTPKTKAEVCLSGMCGMQSAGCNSEMVDCGTCPTGQSCGAVVPSYCGVGATTCVPKTAANACAYAVNSCGPQSDGCGGSVVCPHTCTWPERCTGTPTTCAVPNITGCTNLCPYIDTSCTAAGKTPTQLTGKVYAPNGTLPIYNALVYVPNGTLPSIKNGASCERCEDENLGSPIAAARTGADGSFTLKNIPAGKSFPLVVKVGKWRRVVTIPAVTNCTSVALTAEQTRLPKNKTDAATANVQYVNIPKFAVVTGYVDAMECVLRKIGISDSEFTRPSAAGRIHMYRAPMKFKWDGTTVSSGGGGVMGCTKFRSGSTTRCATAQDVDVVQDPLENLFAGTTLNNYDVAVFDCEGAANDHDTLDKKLLDWANAGGRVFSSHYSYKYLDDNGTFGSSAVWNGSDNFNDQTTGIIDKSSTNAKGIALNTWLGKVGAWSSTYGDGYMTITDPRDYVKSVNASSERFVYTDTSVRIGGAQICDANAIQQYAFNTPYGASAANICGRVLYSAFHVADVSNPSDKVFPSYCSTGALTAQEKTLMFMLFDLSACVSVGEPPSPPTCTKNTCSALGANCGSMPDGCGGLLSCGTCEAPDTCGGGGTPNVCGSNCTRTTCGAQGANCGLIADGCGGILECGTCDSPAFCGGGGTPNVCGTAICTPRTCAAAGAQCGFISDGCGSTVDCGDCTTGVCGGGGTPNVCATTGTCTPATSCGTAKCGYVSDGCGDAIDCGTCDTGYTCVAGVCTGSSCTPRTCASVNANCGFIGDGCGGTVDCGVCTVPGQTCGGGGVPSQCGGSCTPVTCSSVGAECGAISNGCGGITDCGVCEDGLICGGAGPNKCGGTACAATTCSAAGASCGSIGNGCGDVLDCGPCPAGQACVANQCVTGGGCVPLTCLTQTPKVYCGPAADGCGSLLDCGTCPPGETCGGSGTPGVCGKSIQL